MNELYAKNILRRYGDKNVKTVQIDKPFQLWLDENNYVRIDANRFEGEQDIKTISQLRKLYEKNNTI